MYLYVTCIEFYDKVPQFKSDQFLFHDPSELIFVRVPISHGMSSGNFFFLKSIYKSSTFSRSLDSINSGPICFH